MYEMMIDLFDSYLEAKGEIKAYRYYSRSNPFHTKYDYNKDILYQRAEGYSQAMRDAICIFGQWSEYKKYRKSDEGKAVYKEAYLKQLRRLIYLDEQGELVF